MRKDIEELHTQLIEAHEKYVKIFNKLDLKIKGIIDFDGGLTYCEGDGHLVINDNSASVGFFSCLKGRTKTNKLTEKEHDSYCI